MYYRHILNRPARYLTLLALFSATTPLPTEAAEPGVEEIRVTATLREERWLDVPIALSALSTAQLQDARILDIRDVTRLAPALDMQTNTGPTQVGYRIRRVGNLGNIPTFDSAVGVYIDGAFRQRPLFGAADLIDIERIEILRGPQSTLYGKNASAGVIGIHTREPAPTPAAELELTGGVINSARNATLYRLRSVVATPLGSDSLRTSLAVAYSGHDHSEVSVLQDSAHDTNAQNRLTLRGQLYWRPRDTEIRMIVGAIHDDADQHDGDLYYDPNGWVANIILPTLTEAGLRAPCRSNDPLDRRTCTRNAIHSDLRAHDATLLIDHATSDRWTLSSITSVDHFRFEGRWDDAVQLGAPLLRFHDTQEAVSLQQQFRIALNSEHLDQIIGLFYYENRFDFGDGENRPEFLWDSGSAHTAVIGINELLFGTPLPMATPGQAGYLASTQELRSSSLFWQADWCPAPHLTLSTGVRWLQEEKQARINNGVNDSTPSILSLLLTPPSVNGQLSRTTDGLSWTVSPQWHLNDQRMLYATLSRGFKPGGFNIGFGSLGLTQREFDDEHVAHYEAGLKTTLSDGTAQAAVALFHTTYRDYQDAAFIGGQFSVGNAEQTDLQGFELDLNVAITPNFSTALALSYADLVYEENTTGQCHPLRIPNDSSGACTLSGEHPINAPLWRTHVDLQWRQPQGSWERFERIDWHWSSRYNTSFSADPLLEQKAYHWLDLRAGVRRGHTELSVWVSNLLNEAVVDVATVQNIYAGTGDGSTQTYLQSPRTCGITWRTAL